MVGIPFGLNPKVWWSSWQPFDSARLHLFSWKIHSSKNDLRMIFLAKTYILLNISEPNIFLKNNPKTNHTENHHPPKFRGLSSFFDFFLAVIFPHPPPSTLQHHGITANTPLSRLKKSQYRKYEPVRRSILMTVWEPNKTKQRKHKHCDGCYHLPPLWKKIWWSLIVDDDRALFLIFLVKPHWTDNEEDGTWPVPKLRWQWKNNHFQ